jgi:hypothetical protein
MIWAGMTLDYLTGPYFFDGLLNAASYLAILETWLRDTGFFLCAMFWMTILQAAGLTVFHWLIWPSHGHNVITPNNSLWSNYEWKSGCISPHHKWGVVQSCGRLLLPHYSTSALTNIIEDMEVHLLARPASRCMNGSTRHVTKKCVAWYMVTSCPACRLYYKSLDWDWRMMSGYEKKDQ